MNSVWTEAKLSRSTAAVALLVIIATNAYFVAITPPLGPPEPSAQQIVTWTHSHQQQLLFQFVPAYTALIYAVLIGLLIRLTGASGVLANLAWLAMAANFALGLVTFGIYFEAWTYLQRGGTDDGVGAMASIAPLFTHGQLIPVGIAITCVGLFGLRARVWPIWLSWLSLVVGAEHVLSPIAFAAAPSFSTTGVHWSLGAIARVFDILLEYLWLLAVVLVLVIRPVRGQGREVSAPGAGSSFATAKELRT